MNRVFSMLTTGLLMACILLPLTSCSKDDSTATDEPSTQQIHYTFASKTEGMAELMSNERYYNSLNQADLDWRLHKTGATLDELKSFAKAQVTEFTDEQKAAIKKGIAVIEERLTALNIRLPLPKNITFVSTTAKEESGSTAYTHKTSIYLGPGAFKWMSSKPDDRVAFYSFVSALAHELFHCLTRNDADFRKTMYGLIGFTVMDHELELKGENKNMILANPDVEHIDNYAEFTINGQKRKCELIVLYTKTWEEASAAVEDPSQLTFFRYFRQVLVPIDATDTNYDISTVPDFWEKVGRNTEYVFAPEECLADNFSYAITYGLNGMEYKTPELIQKIITTLQSMKY